MSTDVKNFIDGLAGIFAAAGLLVTHVVTLVAGLFAIAWYAHRFNELRKEKRNGN